MALLHALIRCPICRRRKVAKKDDWCRRCIDAVRDHWSMELHRLEEGGSAVEYRSHFGDSGS